MKLPEPDLFVHNEGLYVWGAKANPELSGSQNFTGYYTATQLQEAYTQGLEDAAAVVKPKCTECAKWRKEKADNKEWMDGVKRGREIVEQMVRSRND